MAPGQNLAHVADPGRLKVELKIAETQARDVVVARLAYIDTRNGIPERVSRKDPSAANGTVTVDVTLTAAFPRGAVPDLSVDGGIDAVGYVDVECRRSREIAVTARRT